MRAALGMLVALALGCDDGRDRRGRPADTEPELAEWCEAGTLPPCDTVPVVEYTLEAHFSVDEAGTVIAPYRRGQAERRSVVAMKFPDLHCEAILYLDGLPRAPWTDEEGWLFGVDVPDDLEGVHNCTGFDPDSFEGADPLEQLRSEAYRARRLAFGGPLPAEVAGHRGGYTPEEVAEYGFGGLIDTEAFSGDDFGGLDTTLWNLVTAARIDAYYDVVVLNPDGSEERVPAAEILAAGAPMRALYHVVNVLPHVVDDPYARRR